MVFQNPGRYSEQRGGSFFFVIDHPLESFNRQSAAEQISRYRCYDRARGAGRSLAGALHQGSHVLQKFVFSFFLPSRVPLGDGPLRNYLHLLLFDAAEELIPASPAFISFFRPVAKKKGHHINPSGLFFAS